jgi:hypothetical protein
MASNKAGVVRDITKQDAEVALDRLLTLIGAGEDETGDAFSFFEDVVRGESTSKF